MKAALYALHYINSMHNYSTSFTSDNIGAMHSFIHYLPSTNVKAYNNATPPKPTNSSTLSSDSDACWGLQIGSAMSGGIVFKNGGPLGWLSKCQEHTSVSSCKVEILATSTKSKKVVDLRNICQSVSNSGFPILDMKSLPLFTMTMKPASSGPITCF
jgi:hypothetical protein